MTYNFGKPVPLEEKCVVGTEEIDEEENEEKYESEEENSISIERKEKELGQYKKIKQEILEEVNLKGLQHGWKSPNTICWCERQLSHKADICTVCQDLYKEIEMLESLVEDLVKELGIEKVVAKVNKLEKEQQIQVEELIEKNKDLFAKGLTQLGRMKKEMHKIVMKEEADLLNKDRTEYPIRKMTLSNKK
ncbi:hypothetical protein F8M41_008731 [Gigaspora margarita]|uniref:Uncharacterized protein n=1 Tax=Gigaspora margarita TaxID=4874 RepID=A0A8H3X329_GIGMA|nr:hypothetical protein F8M41_008731 [Gigaspora margarita]